MAYHQRESFGLIKVQIEIKDNVEIAYCRFGPQKTIDSSENKKQNYT